MKVTDKEKLEIISHLEADRDLPEKYRFLLFGDKREVELVWNGKTNEICNIVLPFQTLERVGELQAEKPSEMALERCPLVMDKQHGRPIQGWSNKLIRGDNKFILSSLKHGPLRKDIETQGGLKLIYIDPPFDVGADFSMDIEFGGDRYTQTPNILEEVAYRDSWGRGPDSFIAMMYERLVLMRDLLAEDGSIYVHCDWRVNSLIRLALDEIFGSRCFQREIIWRIGWVSGYKTRAKNWIRNHDTILFYTKNPNRFTFNKEYIPYDEDYVRRDGKKPTGPGYPIEDTWNCSDIDRLDSIQIMSFNTEKTGYDTQKNENLLQRIIEASSNEGDLVADFFCGSGTTAAVAEKLGRKWIAADLGKLAIHTTRKRMIGVQRQLEMDDKPYHPFEVLNLGKYERHHFVGLNPNLPGEEQQNLLAGQEAELIELIVKAYQAEKEEDLAPFQGKRNGRMVAIGPVNGPVKRLFIEEIMLASRKKHVSKVDILGFEFEPGLFPCVLDEARSKGIDIAFKFIPAEVFDKKAVEKNQVVFHHVAAIEVEPHVKRYIGGDSFSVTVELTGFSVLYSPDSNHQAETSLKNKGSKLVEERGQIVKVSKDARGVVTREQMTQFWQDWIDYWAVDFNFAKKQEIIQVKDEETGQWEEHWTGNYIFENHWQSFRTKKDRSLEIKSIPYDCKPGPRKIAVKVVDIFGNETMTTVELNIGEKGGTKQ